MRGGERLHSGIEFLAYLFSVDIRRANIYSSRKLNTFPRDAQVGAFPVYIMRATLPDFRPMNDLDPSLV